MSAQVVSLLEPWSADYGNVRAAGVGGGLRRLRRDGCSPRPRISLFWAKPTERLAAVVLQRRPERNRHRAWVMIAAGHLAFQLGQGPDPAGLMTAAELSVELGDRAAEAAAHLPSAQHMFSGAPEKGRAVISPPSPRSHGTPRLIGQARGTAALGLTHFMDGEPRCRSRAA